MFSIARPSRSATDIPVYYGIGGRIKTGGNGDDRIGVRIVGGIAYYIPDAPIDLFAGNRPDPRLRAGHRPGAQCRDRRQVFLPVAPGAAIRRRGLRNPNFFVYWMRISIESSQDRDERTSQCQKSAKFAKKGRSAAITSATPTTGPGGVGSRTSSASVRTSTAGPAGCACAPPASSRVGCARPPEAGATTPDSEAQPRVGLFYFRGLDILVHQSGIQPVIHAT